MRSEFQKFSIGLSLIVAAATYSACTRPPEVRETSRESSPGPSPSPPTSVTSPDIKNLTAQVANLVGDPEVFQLTPATVAQKVERIVKLSSAERTEAVWRFTGRDPARAVQWAIADFQPSEDPKRAWTLLQMRLAFSPSNQTGQTLYESLKSNLDKVLRKVGASTKTGPVQQTTWQVAEYKAITLIDAEFESPIDQRRERGVVLEIAIPQGEAEP